MKPNILIVATLYGFIFFHEVLARPASIGLDRLARRIAEGSLRPHISVQEDWSEIGMVSKNLIDRNIYGQGRFTRRGVN